MRKQRPAEKAASEQKLRRPSAAAHASEVKDLRWMAQSMEDDFKNAMREVVELRAENEKLTLQLQVRRHEITILRQEKEIGDLTEICRKAGKLP